MTIVSKWLKYKLLYVTREHRTVNSNSLRNRTDSNSSHRLDSEGLWGWVGGMCGKGVLTAPLSLSPTEIST